jgi:ketosteroid isomerase-like protein
VSEYAKRIEAGFEAFNNRDFDVLVDLCHPQVEWTPPAELPGSRTYHGREGVREAVTDMVSIFGDLRAEAAGFEEQDGRVIGFYYWRGTGSSSGASIDAFEVQAGFICDFEDDLVKTARFWTTWEDTRREAGLSASR